MALATTPMQRNMAAAARKVKKPADPLAGWGDIRGGKASPNGPVSQGPNATPKGPAPVSVPDASLHVTPVAPPPIDPFSTPTDMANQTLENASWDQYLSGIDLALQDLQVQSTAKLSDLGLAEAQNKEAINWNAAARGLSGSSIRDQDQAKAASQVATQRTAVNDTLGNQKTYNAGEHQRVDTTIKPAIGTKYADLAVRNAREANANQAPPDTPDAPAAPAAPPAPSNLSNDTAANNAGQAAAGTPTPVVKDGKFYRVYNRGTGAERWVYVRPAG